MASGDCAVPLRVRRHHAVLRVCGCCVLLPRVELLWAALAAQKPSVLLAAAAAAAAGQQQGAHATL